MQSALANIVGDLSAKASGDLKPSFREVVGDVDYDHNKQKNSSKKKSSTQQPPVEGGEGLERRVFLPQGLSLIHI